MVKIRAIFFLGSIGLLVFSAFYLGPSRTLHVRTGTEYFVSPALMTPSEQRALRMSSYVERYQYILPSPRDVDPQRPQELAKKCGSDKPDFSHFWTLPMSLRSQYDEDKTVYELFFKGKNISNGTYIELGAFNGLKESNTLFFESCLGWEGLLIEASPINYLFAVQNRPYAHRMSFAPSCRADNGTMVPFYIYPWTNVGLVGHAKSYQGGETVDVPCGPLGPVLQDVFGEKPIRFFSLDVEGAERLVLDTIDFDKVMIDVIMIEIQNAHCQHDDCEVRRRVRAKMDEVGYRRHQGLVTNSDIYVHPLSEFQLSSVY